MDFALFTIFASSFVKRLEEWCARVLATVSVVLIMVDSAIENPVVRVRGKV